MNYILVIPARNEEQRLPLALNSIIGQSLLPRLCLIVDDGSSDGTSRIISNYERAAVWIRHICTEHPGKISWSLSKRDIAHFARIVSQGISVARRMCEEQGLTYEYIAKVDADFVLPSDYFQKLLKRFDEDDQLGIASGDAYLVENRDQAGNWTNLKHQRILSDEPSDGARVYRSSCYDGIGGLPLVGAPDSAALALARTLGWSTRRFKDLRIYATRKSVGGGSAWRGFRLSGMNAYACDYHPALVCMRVAYFVLHRPHYHSVAFALGYVSAAIRRDPKVADERIRRYYRGQRLRELARLALARIGGLRWKGWAFRSDRPR